jgi:hypothetical protein
MTTACSRTRNQRDSYSSRLVCAADRECWRLYHHTLTYPRTLPVRCKGWFAVGIAAALRGLSPFSMDGIWTDPS